MLAGRRPFASPTPFASVESIATKVYLVCPWAVQTTSEAEIAPFEALSVSTTIDPYAVISVSMNVDPYACESV